MRERASTKQSKLAGTTAFSRLFYIGEGMRSDEGNSLTVSTQRTLNWKLTCRYDCFSNQRPGIEDLSLRLLSKRVQPANKPGAGDLVRRHAVRDIDGRQRRERIRPVAESARESYRSGGRVQRSCDGLQSVAGRAFRGRFHLFGLRITGPAGFLSKSVRSERRDRLQLGTGVDKRGTGS